VPPSSNGTLFAEFDPNAYSSDGPLPVAYADYVYDSANAFVEGMAEIGIPYNPELNNGTNVGAKREPFTSDGFRRASSYDAYYLPVENRTNLHVATRAQVQSIILEQKVNGSLLATGVVYNDIASGMTLNVSANNEVILSAGAIQTPQVLMLSVSEGWMDSGVATLAITFAYWCRVLDQRANWTRSGFPYSLKIQTLDSSTSWRCFAKYVRVYGD